ncbi:MAG: GreA/GreB family elongation factor [Deltaproteobacteria bacterium]|nr:GreA/GreB family elongation factor [Deltaproteobacteria bacterium]
MSKAFTKESEYVPESPIRRLGVPVPELNVVTPEGLRAARAELDELQRTGGDPDRIRELTDHLLTATAIEPEDREVVGVGARVVVEDDVGTRSEYRIVGAIEADVKRGWIGWMTPLAQALWGARVGDTVNLPRGEAEVVSIEY